jgi:hypothetical protein
MNMARKSNKNIRRLKYGWQFYTTLGGELHTKFFSTSDYGRSAVTAAREYRDEYMANLERRPNKISSRNTSGKRGISQWESDGVIRIRASLMVNGERRTRTFTAKNERQVKSKIRLAVKWRNSQKE